MVSLSVVFCFHGERSVILKALWPKDFDRISAACLRHAACTMLHWNGGRTVTILFFTTAQLTLLVVVSIHMKLPPAVYLFVSLHTCRVRLYVALTVSLKMPLSAMVLILQIGSRCPYENLTTFIHISMSGADWPSELTRFVFLSNFLFKQEKHCSVFI